MTSQQDYQKKMRVWLDEWQTGLEELKAQADQSKGEAKLKYREYVQKLSDQQVAIRQNFDALSHTDKANWENNKADIDARMSELQQTFDQFEQTGRQYGDDVLGWAKGIAQEHKLRSIGWAEGLATESPVESIGWAEGIAEEDPVESAGWVEGYDKKR